MKTVAIGTLQGSLIAVRLCGPSGPVVLLCERQLTELREKLVEALKWDRLRRRDLVDAIGHPSAVSPGVER